MGTHNLPFTLGEQFELYEFELDMVETILIGDYEYEVYRCSNKLFEKIKILGLNDVLLYYNADILAKVNYRFKSNSIKRVMNLFTPSKDEDIIIFRHSIDYIEVVVTHSKYYG